MEEEKKTIVLKVSVDIFEEFKMQIENFIDDFYGQEKSKIEIIQEQ